MSTRWASVRAVVAGILVIVVTSTAIDVVLQAIGFLPPMNRPLDDAQALVATSYRVVFGVAGGWVTARLAPGHPMRHALALGALGVVLGAAAVVATWDSNLGPRWYGLSHVVLALPEVWLGAWIVERRSTRNEG